MTTTQANRASVLTVAALFAGLAVGINVVQAQSTFQGLGQFPGSNSNSVSNVSNDGNVVVGTIMFSSFDRAFRWTDVAGFENLGTLPNFPEASTRAYAVSHDGSVVVGVSIGGNPKAVRWEQGVGFVSLGAGMATACSNDGSVVAGMGSYDATLPHFSVWKGFRWTQRTGYVQFGGGFMPGSGFLGSSPDGTNLVGFTMNDIGKCWMARYNPSSGFMFGFAFIPSGVGAATSSSNDGTVGVGYNGGNAIRWTQASGVVKLGDGFSTDCSGDGSIVVGANAQGKAFIWDGANGMRDLREVLISDYGITNLDGWTLTVANAITGDGQTIVGTGINPAGKEEGWIARLSDGPVCYPDCDASGGLNIDDFICYQTIFALGEPAADCDGDGSLTIDDFVCFQTMYAMGC